jgi:hypothetical protein
MAKSVLIIGPQCQQMETLNPLWDDLGLEQNRFATAAAALEVLRTDSLPRAILISYPLWDIDLGDLLQGVGRVLGEGHRIPISVMASREALHEIDSLTDRGITVLSDGLSSADLVEMVENLLKQLVRASPRFIVRLTVQVGDGKLLRACQSENVSESGMLIRTSEEFPIGSRVRVEFPLPHDQGLIRGEAAVVRHTLPHVEGMRGMGVKFVSFEQNGQEKLKEFLAQGSG